MSTFRPGTPTVMRRDASGARKGEYVDFLRDNGDGTYTVRLSRLSKNICVDSDDVYNPTTDSY
jgi:hypothetical protein